MMTVKYFMSSGVKSPVGGVGVDVSVGVIVGIMVGVQVGVYVADGNIVGVAGTLDCPVLDEQGPNIGDSQNRSQYPDEKILGLV